MYSFLPGAKYSANYGSWNKSNFRKMKPKPRKKSMTVARPSKSSKSGGTPTGTPVKEPPSRAARRQSVAQIVINKATNKFRAKWKRKMETSLQDYDLPKSKR